MVLEMQLRIVYRDGLKKMMVAEGAVEVARAATIRRTGRLRVIRAKNLRAATEPAEKPGTAPRTSVTATAAGGKKNSARNSKPQERQHDSYRVKSETRH